MRGLKSRSNWARGINPAPWVSLISVCLPAFMGSYFLVLRGVSLPDHHFLQIEKERSRDKVELQLRRNETTHWVQSYSSILHYLQRVLRTWLVGLKRNKHPLACWNYNPTRNQRACRVGPMNTQPNIELAWLVFVEKVCSNADFQWVSLHWDQIFTSLAYARRFRHHHEVKLQSPWLTLEVNSNLRNVFDFASCA